MALRVKMGRRPSPAKHHNSALTAKVEIRRWLVEQLGGIDAVRVLDCFCAKGMLWERAYDRTRAYLGLDVRRFDDDRATITGDSRRFLRHRDVALERWNLFDLDAFGSPLEHLALVANRLRVPPGQRVGFVLTDGAGFNARMNSTPKGLLAYVGISRHRGAHVQAELRDEVFSRAVTKALDTARLKLVAGKFSESTKGAGMKYVALLAEGL